MASGITMGVRTALGDTIGGEMSWLAEQEARSIRQADMGSALGSLVDWDHRASSAKADSGGGADLAISMAAMPNGEDEPPRQVDLTERPGLYF